MNHEAFIKDLVETFKRHGVTSLSGCGCCGSPFAYAGDTDCIDNISIDLKQKTATYSVDGQGVEIKLEE